MTIINYSADYRSTLAQFAAIISHSLHSRGYSEERSETIILEHGLIDEERHIGKTTPCDDTALGCRGSEYSTQLRAVVTSWSSQPAKPNNFAVLQSNTHLVRNTR